MKLKNVERNFSSHLEHVKQCDLGSSVFKPWVPRENLVLY